MLQLLQSMSAIINIYEFNNKHKPTTANITSKSIRDQMYKLEEYLDRFGNKIST